MTGFARRLWHFLPQSFRTSLVRVYIRFFLRLHALIDTVLDFKYGVRTSAILAYDKNKQAEAGLANADPFSYIPSPYLPLFRIVSRFKPSRTDVVFDLGCGRGRSLFVFANSGVTKVVGIEFEKSLYGSLEENLRSFRGRRNIEIVNDDVLNCDMDEATVVYMFNPFGGDTMRDLTGRLEDSLKRKPRKLSIIYWRPLFLDELKGLSGFRIVTQFTQRNHAVVFAEAGQT